MGMTYILHEGEHADSFCEQLIVSLPVDTLTVRELPRGASNISKLYIERPQELDLYTAVTEALRANVDWDLWSSVVALDVDPNTAAAVAPTQWCRATLADV
jgi:hypothetical protein